MALLARDAGKVIGHRDLLVAVWGAAHRDDSQYLRVVVGQLRQTLKSDPARLTLIETEPGVGYRLNARRRPRGRQRRVMATVPRWTLPNGRRGSLSRAFPANPLRVREARVKAILAASMLRVTTS